MYPKNASLINNNPPTPSQVPNCKFFFPCNEGSGNILRCPITGAVWDATSAGHTLQWGTVANAVRTAVYEEFLPTLFTSGAYPALSPAKHWTFIAAVRVIEQHSAFTCRVALGDNSDEVNSGTPNSSNTGFGWGISDGNFHTAVSTAMSPKTQMRRGWQQYPLEPDDPSRETILSVDTTTDIITFDTAHSFVTGDMTDYEVTVGSITPLVHLEIYYVIKVDATRVKLATTQANALAGTAIDLTAASVTALSLYYANSIRMHGFGKNMVLVATHVPGSAFNLTAYDIDTGATIADANVARTGTLPSTQNVTFEPYFRFSNYDLYGLSLHESTAALPSLAMGALTQGAYWKNGDKRLYGGWIGVT